MYKYFFIGTLDNLRQDNLNSCTIFSYNIYITYIRISNGCLCEYSLLFFRVQESYLKYQWESKI